MSQTRQGAAFDRRGGGDAQISTLTRDYPRNHKIAWHFHDRDQLVYASHGVMTVQTDTGTWIVPTHRAVWIPARIPHTIVMAGEVAMRTLYVKRGLARSLPRECCVVNVAPLLRELVLHACSFPTLRSRIPGQRHVIGLILDQLAIIQMVPLQLPHLSDPRAVRVSKLLLADPGSNRTLSHLCKAGGAGKRTVERLFQSETGMSFGKWRQQLRMMYGVRLLAEGAKVTAAAVEAGYSSPSAFISVFRKNLGTTPSRYFNPSTTTNVIKGR